MISSDQAQDIIGTTLYDPSGDKIGKIGQVYYDDATGNVAWATVSTGLFGTRESFVPLSEANLTSDGVTVPYDKDRIKGAPNIDADTHLSGAEEAELYRYYGLDYGGGYATDDLATSGTGYTGTETYAESGTTGTRGTTGTDDAMTLSEERVNVGTERRETGKVRLRKYVVTENVTKTVPVTREEVRLEREPISEGNVGDALSGPDISEAEHTVTLHEERPVVDKETVPVERVRLETDTVVDEVAVNEEVRKERVETEGDVSGDRDRF